MKILNTVLRELFKQMTKSKVGEKITITLDDFTKVKISETAETVMEAVKALKLEELNTDEEVQQEVELAMESITSMREELEKIEGRLAAIHEKVETISDVRLRAIELMRKLETCQFTYEATDGTSIEIIRESCMKCIPDLLIIMEEARRQRLIFEAEMKIKWEEKMRHIMERHEREIIETTGVFISEEIVEYRELVTGFATKHAYGPDEPEGPAQKEILVEAELKDATLNIQD
ncbi:uncharacterized protein [Branchiostoma lanceolatum]|uniref:uncharacterized protein n=1 Tax=Branchiostoma lanceolatum TaxID=7740 RepID=UPI003456F626